MTKKAIVLLVCALWLVSCALNPVTGKRELSLISEEGEIALGKETDPQIRQQYGTYDNAALAAYVARVGSRLVPYSHRPQLAYSFQVLDSPVVNAFAVPGGFVYVTRGALAMMNTESELAVVLGHELGHIAARHSVRRLSSMILLQVGLAVASTISKPMATIAGVAGVGIQLLYLKFSRDDERQADALGVQYSRAASFNPGQMVNFFASLQKLGDMSGKSSLPGFLSTHPLSSERIQNVTAMLTEADKAVPIGREAFLQSINNIVYGEDPRQGYVENNAFYHPSLRFVFAIPQGWKVQNSPSQVTLASSDEQAAFVLQAEKSSQGLEAYAAKTASELEGRQLLHTESPTINGLSAFIQVYDIPSQDSATLRARLSFIRKGEMIYTLAALSQANTFGGYDTHFKGILRSFRELTNPAHINRAPQRLKLIKASGGQSLQDIFKASGLKQDVWPKVALMNEMELTARPAAGQWVKIIQ